MLFNSVLVCMLDCAHILSMTWSRPEIRNRGPTPSRCTPGSTACLSSSQRLRRWQLLLCMTSAGRGTATARFAGVQFHLTATRSASLRLAGIMPSQLPLNHPRPPGQTFAGGTIPLAIRHATVEGLRRAARAAGGTLFTRSLPHMRGGYICMPTRPTSSSAARMTCVTVRT